MTLEKNEREVSLRIVRSDGLEFYVGRRSNWLMKNDAIADWNNQALSVNTAPNVLTDGSRLVSKRVDEKDRTFTAVYMGENQAIARSTAMSFFNPKHKFRVYITYHGKTRWCEGEQIGFQCSTENIYQPPTITWTLLCLDPYMRDVDRNDKQFGDAISGFGFPFVSHLKSDKNRPKDYPAGFIVSRKIYDGKNTIYNNGDVSVRYTVEIKAHGEIINPAIVKDGRHVKIMKTLQSGDVLLIDFESMKASVKLNGDNAIGYASRDSAFKNMQMQVGENQFYFECDNMTNRSLAEVRVMFNKAYLGV